MDRERSSFHFFPLNILICMTTLLISREEAVKMLFLPYVKGKKVQSFPVEDFRLVI